MVAQLLYTQWVGGSNPSSPTNFSKTEIPKAETLKCGRAANALAKFPLAWTENLRHKTSMKTLIASALAVVASVSLVFGQAEQVKGKAKDLKKKIEGQQTNQVQNPAPPKK